MNTETPSNNQITDLETKAKIFAINKHSAVNHNYDNKQYSVHFENVVFNAKKYIDKIVPKSFHQEVIASCWLHDTIEDCRLTIMTFKKSLELQSLKLFMLVVMKKERIERSAPMTNITEASEILLMQLL